MRDEKSKLIKIMNELVRFYLKNGIHHVEMKLDYEKDYGTVSLSGCCAKIEDSVLEDLNQMWYDHEVWPMLFHQVHRWDELINEFNQRTGVLALL